MHLAEHVTELIDAFSELIAQHIKLAKVELKEDAKAIGIQVGKIAAFVPLLVIGLILLNIAGALFLRRFMAADLAFLVVALLNFAVGGLGIFLAVKALQGRRVMDGTKAELQSTAIVLRSERQ